MTAPVPFTFGKQAEFLRYLVDRTRMADGTQSAETWLQLKQPDIDDLNAIIARLERMAPHEDEIRRIVTRGRRG